MKLQNIKIVRKLLLPVLKKLSPGTITIKHHYTKDKIILDFFNHKGYWFYGKQREESTMSFFADLITEGFTVIEAGGHIGYLSLYFAQLTGKKGKVFVFEPGENNRQYISKNVEHIDNIRFLDKAVSDKSGKVSFYVDNMTGQNNSLNKDYKGIVVNSKNFFTKAEFKEVEVEAVSLDDFVETEKINADFIKIDIESAELLALKGMSKILKNSKPIMMIEITLDHEMIFNLLTRAGYVLFSEDRNQILKYQELSVNNFCLNKEKHKSLIDSIINT